ncbi:Protein of unknown function (DUF4448) domain containing protein [Naviculisporaceae sp. PSN 640]
MPNVAPLATLAVRAALWPWGGGSPATTTLAPTTTSLVPTSTAPPPTAWVTVNRDHEATTVTPVVTTIDGEPTTISPLPYVLTGTIFSTRVHMDISTSTGSAVPTANKHGEGAFIRCYKPDSPNNPFCLPKQNQTLHAGVNYFVTWDNAYLNNTKSKVRVRGFYDTSYSQQAFESDKIDPTRGFYQWTYWKELYKERNLQGVPIYLQLSVPINETSGETVHLPGPTVHARPKFKRPIHHPTDPTGKVLTIGLPVVFGSLFLFVIGISFMNRKVRRIGIGNVMSRSRRYLKKGSGRFGRSKSRSKRARREDKEQGMPLMERERDSNEYKRDW